MSDLRTTEQILEANYPYYSYIRTDRNGTRYFSNCRCDKCGGRGYIDCYRFIDGGVCFDCGGSGRREKPQLIKIYTPEHEEKLAAQRNARAAKKAEERKQEAIRNRGSKLEAIGFGKEDEYVIYRVVGNTFSIKDTLKSLGCKFNPCVGWYAPAALEGYECQRFTESEVLTEDVFITWKDKDEVSPLWIENIRKVEESTSEWIGEIGERIEINIHIDRRFESHYQITSWKSTTSYMYLMHDAAGNVYKWSSSNYFNENEDIKIRCTVKDHCEYKGIKQTVVTRGKEI